MRKSTFPLLSFLVACAFVLALLGAQAALAAGQPQAPAPATGALDASAALRAGVTITGVRAHQAALQAIAEASPGGNRAAGTPGYDASADYVREIMEAAGYTVTLQEFTTRFSGDVARPVLEQVAPQARTFAVGADFVTLEGSGSGTITATLTVLTGTAALGCSAADWAAFPAGDVALVTRGLCTFGAKAALAQQAGAAALLIQNQARGLAPGSLGGVPARIPVLALSGAAGEDLRATARALGTGLTLHVSAQTVSERRTTANVIAESPGGDPETVVVVGAHLDSVIFGPGINDNGSGVATVLEVARVLAQEEIEPRNKLRFIFFAAEEMGLVGSRRYVDSLAPEEKERIAVMLNFDMIGSPNGIRYVYDGDASGAPPGSAAIEQVFRDFFETEGLDVAQTALLSRSDGGPFARRAGVPVGGLFSGAEGTKSARQAETYGGTAGQPLDPCYHLACDTYAQTGSPNALSALDVMADAAAHAIYTFVQWEFVEK